MGAFKFAIIILFAAICLGYFGYKNPEYRKHFPTDVQKWVDEKIDFINERLFVSTTGTKKSTQTSTDAKSEIKQTQEKTLQKDGETIMFTKEELWRDYRGTEGSKGLYLAFMGKVYNVAKGKDYYAPGGGYSFFSGRDGTKGFSTGDFTDAGLIDDISDMTPSRLVELKSWVKLYEDDYIYVGKVVGFFYDENGQETEAYKNVLVKIEQGKKEKEIAEDRNKALPQCNSEWKKETGSRVWCTTKSGGIERNWIGVPRSLHLPGYKEPWCVCVKNTGPPTEVLASSMKTTNQNNGDLDYPYITLYKNCDPNSFECKIV